MAILALSPNNKNQFRKYPLKQGSTNCSDDGFIFSDKLVVNCSISSVVGWHRVYIKQIFYKDGLAKIAVASVGDDMVLGCFSGQISEGFTVLTLEPFVRNVSGTLTVAGTQEWQGITRTLTFNPDAAEIEESAVFCYTVPRVTSILDRRDLELRGDVNFGVLINLTKISDISTNTSQLAVISPQSVFNLADTSSLLGNCPTPVIYTINSVEPYPIGAESSVNDGNIYILGIKPIVFFGIPGTDGLEPGILHTDTGDVTLNSLCTARNKILPPVNITGFTLPEFKDQYFMRPALAAGSANSIDTPDLQHPARAAGNFNITIRPEYYYWPQFVQEPYFAFWPTPPSS